MTRTSTRQVLVIGAGPAGSTAARLLAQWGHSVVVMSAPPKGPALAECLPPSTQKVFRFLGIREAVDSAGFLRTTGNTVWWEASRRRVEAYPEGAGYQVPRRELDHLLLGLAESAGAELRTGSPLPQAAFVLDCSGRAGVLARKHRVKPRNSRTIALCGIWYNDSGWKLPDATHTLIEAYPDGWAWSVPLSKTVRHVAFMVDPVETKMVRGKGLALAYSAEMAKTRAFRRIFARGTLQGAPWGRDASPYTSRQFCGPGFLLAGDAASFIDPLSSFGVKKAMVSGWAGAVVANTCLRRPSMQEAALRFYNDRERETFEGYSRQTNDWSRAAYGSEAERFWLSRSGVEADKAISDRDGAAARQALAGLRRRASISLSLAPGIDIVKIPAIAGNEIILREALAGHGIQPPLDYIANVDVCLLVKLAPHCRQVPDLFDAYNRHVPPVDLPHFLTALSTLLARKILG